MDNHGFELAARRSSSFFLFQRSLGILYKSLMNAAPCKFPLIRPRIVPPLDSSFRPAVLANRAFREGVRALGEGIPLLLAMEQADGSVFHHQEQIYPSQRVEAAGNFNFVERLLKFLLWSRGGCKVYVAGPEDLGSALRKHFLESATGRFDAEIMGERIYERPLEILSVNLEDLPPPRQATNPLGRHLDGCRIGFDLGASDRKAAAIKDGQVVFSEEIVWDPVQQKDPQWHFHQIMDSLKRAADHLPQVDAIGGSAAGVYVSNRVKVASLFRGVPEELFHSRVKDLFLDIQKAWNGIPFQIANDGDVTALAGSMAIGDNGVLGVAMGSSQAAGYVDQEGHITTWLNELAFAPVDYNPSGPVDEWSGDIGCGVQYCSQQAVGRLMPLCGIDACPESNLPSRLKHVQKLMETGDNRARKIYQTIGTYLGYAIAHYADFYEFRHLLILGRVTTGRGGDLILENARNVLASEFPSLNERVNFHVPDEKEKRHGQAIAAASLPSISK